MPSAALALPPPLYEGDQMDAAEFLRRWEALPDLKYAELTEGVVFLPSPVSREHARAQHRLGAWLFQYERKSPGCGGAAEMTWVMDAGNVPQPDLFLSILPEYGGQSGTTADGKYESGAPELVVEITGSSRSRDLGVKLRLYARMRVREYLTVELYSQKVTWRALVDGRYEEIVAGDDGVLRSLVFPGLWLKPEALWDGSLVEAGEAGLGSAEHGEFVKMLGSRWAD